MHSKIHVRALAVIDPVLRNGPWASGAWDERTRRFGTSFLTALRDAVATLPPMGAVETACSVARGELPLASAIFHETWSRVTLVWVVRAAVQVAHEQTDTALCEELQRIAAELAAAAVAVRAAPGPVQTTNVPFEQMVDAARDAFGRAHEGMNLSPDERAFFSAYMHQYKHIASLLAVGGHSVDSLMRGAIARADRAARRDGLSLWLEAPLAARQRWVQRGVVEAAWSLAAQVVREQSKGDSRRDIALWLSRTACQLLARIDRVEGWVPTVVSDTSAMPPAPQQSTAPAEAREPTKTETPMDSSKLSHPVLKTLEVDATEAAWRMAGSQFVKLAKEPIIALLSRHLGPDDASLRARIAAFLDTELGAALLSGVLSAGLSALPLPPNDVAQRLARELRVRSMATAGDAIADVLMGPLRQVAVMYLQGQPTAPVDPAALPAGDPHNNPLDSLKHPTSAEHVTVATEPPLPR